MAFDAPPAKQPRIRRREFLTWSTGGAFMLAIAGPASAQPPGRGGAAPAGQSPWFQITKEGRLVVLSSAVEMGQGTHTGHATLIAHELDMPWDMVDVQMVDIQQYGNQVFTGGSSSIGGARPGVQPYETARKAGAMAREQFAAAAAKQWNTTPDQVEVGGGKVTNKQTKASLSLGQLASAAAVAQAPDKVAYRERPTNACIGVEMQTKRVVERASGKEIYGLDVRVPGMQRAAVKMTPVFGGKIGSVDDSAALKIPGVTKVVKVDAPYAAVAVIAKDTWTAFKGAEALKINWVGEGASTASTASISQQLADVTKAKFAEAPSANGQAARAAYEGAAKKVSQSYELSHVSHVTMEPQNCVAHVTDEKIEIWAPTQVPTSAKGGAGRWAGKPNAKVILHTTMLGGGFGRRLSTDFIEQAVRIAAQVEGPVHLTWTREEDFTHDTYRRAVLHSYRAGLRPDGLIDGYEAVTVASDAQVGAGPMGAAPYSAIKAANVIQGGTVKAGITQGPWRSVDEGISTWGRESFIDECAVAAGQDPMEYRMKLLGDNARAKRVLQAACDKIDWKKKRPAGTAVGCAVGVGFGSVTAHAVEVQVKGDQLKVTRIAVASDLGTVVAPNQVRAQFEGGSLMALGTALSEAQTFNAGKADKTNFDKYHILRHSQAPKVDVILLESPNERVGGSGEPPVPTLAPALANAVAKASNKRVRVLPFEKAGFKV